jgi:putative oxidoreductase
VSFDWRYLFRMALGVLFAWAALAKIGDLSGFASDVHNFRVLPLAAQNVFAMTIPWVELTAALLLVLNVAPRSGVIVLGGLLVVFLIAISAAIVRHLDIACGCFGTHDAARTGFMTLFRDLGMLALAVLGWPPRKATSSAPWGSRAAETA